MVHFETIATLSEQVRSKQLSATDLADLFLRRIDGLNAKLNAFITVLEDQAMKAARAADVEIARSGWKGPLHGMPIAIKDLFSLEGVARTAGSRMFAGIESTRTAESVSKLLDKGAVILGTLNMDEFAFSAMGLNPLYGDIHNPWALDRTAGGSSGGSGAAVAAGLCVAALGTDTGGSVRIPASFCGVVGYKPTYGIVDSGGIVPLAPSLDHVGFLSRSTVDAGILLEILASSLDRRTSRRRKTRFVDSSRDDLSNVTLGVPSSFFEVCDFEIEALVQASIEVLESLGARIKIVSIPESMSSWKLNAVMEVAESWDYHKEYFEEDSSEYSAPVRFLLEKGREVSATSYNTALEGQSRVREELQRVLESVDALVMPTTPIAAPVSGVMNTSIRNKIEVIEEALAWLVCPFNQAGLPAMSLPCGFTQSRIPVGLQLAAKKWDDLNLIRIANAYENAVGHSQAHPDL